VCLLRDRARDLDELAARQLPDDPGFDAVLEQVLVLALQAQADPLGQDVRDDRPANIATCAIRVVV